MTDIDTLSEQARELLKASFATMSASERTLIRLAKKMANENAIRLAKKLANEIERLRASHDALLEALEGLDPHIDAIICYASTMDEHEPNRLARNARMAMLNARKVTI